MKVDLKDSSAVVTARKGAGFNPTAIRSAIKGAGFSPGPVEVTAAGELRREAGGLVLQMPGRVPKLILAGGAAEAKLQEQLPNLLGRRVQVTGNLHPSHADWPAGITIERFESC